jgi:hypothetical protein
MGRAGIKRRKPKRRLPRLKSWKRSYWRYSPENLQSPSTHRLMNTIFASSFGTVILALLFLLLVLGSIGFVLKYVNLFQS